MITNDLIPGFIAYCYNIIQEGSKVYDFPSCVKEFEIDNEDTIQDSLRPMFFIEWHRHFNICDQCYFIWPKIWGHICGKIH